MPALPAGAKWFSFVSRICTHKHAIHIYNTYIYIHVPFALTSEKELQMWLTIKNCFSLSALKLRGRKRARERGWRKRERMRERQKATRVTCCLLPRTLTSHSELHSATQPINRKGNNATEFRKWIWIWLINQYESIVNTPACTHPSPLSGGSFKSSACYILSPLSCPPPRPALL